MHFQWWVNTIIESRGYGALFSWCFWVIGSVVLHELAHGIAAIRAGDNTPVETGHMTPNPVVHMGMSGLVMFALIGVTWGFMPISPSRFRGRYDHAKVAFAGPLVNILLALLGIAGAASLMALGQRGLINVGPGTFMDNLYFFFRLGALLNLVLAALNLLPIPPLDGSRILANFVPPYRRLIADPRMAGISLVVLIVIFFYAGGAFFSAARVVSDTMIDAIASLVGGP